MMETVHTFLDADVKFASVDEYCTNDSDTPAEFKARLGNGTLQARYQWLWSKTR
jgi:hypothetical protein